MTFEEAQEAYVWVWLPGDVDPVVAGRLFRQGKQIAFNYGQSYLARPNAMAIYEPELPLQSGLMEPGFGLDIASCIRDCAPDAWGRRVILNRLFGQIDHHLDTAELHELTYLLQSGSDRIGALDFQHSATEYIPRSPVNATLQELLEAAERVEKGMPLTPDLAVALQHGTSIGGARPKALIETANKKYIAKFSSAYDTYAVVKSEYVAMKLAKLCGLNVAEVRLESVSGKDILLVERFDRLHTDHGWERKAMVSALTLLRLHEQMARYASYETLAEIIRHRFHSPKETLKELYARLIFNILCGNTDDHARNHAAFWNGNHLELTPAYDICPQPRTGGEASQAMLIRGTGNLSQLSHCIEATSQFLLSEEEAHQIATDQIGVITDSWSEVCHEANLDTVSKNYLWQRQFLNPYAMQSF